MRRRGKEIQGSEPVQRRKEEGKRRIHGFRTIQGGEEAITGLFPDFKENQYKTESIQGFPKNQIKIPDKAR